jgi:uncharacterized protein (DUF39 family)
MIEENRKYILDKRSTTTVELHDMAGITEWENRVKTEGTAISKFYASWIKIHEAQKLKLLNKKEEEFHVPTIKRTKRSADEEDAEDSEEESEFELRVKGAEDAEEKTEKSSSKTKPERSKKKKKKKMMDTKDNTDNTEDKELEKEEETPDILQNINCDDWD